jgi:hypothetical protein
MGHATLWPVPRAIDAEAHHYPRHWKRNLFILYSGALLMGLQVQRYGWICRVSLFIFDITFIFISNLPSKMVNTWIGAATTHQKELDTDSIEPNYI